MVIGAAETELLDYLGRAGVIVFFILLAYSVHKKWIVPGWVYRDLLDRHAKLHERLEKAVENSDAWKEQAWTNARLTEKAVDTNRSIVDNNRSIADEALERGRKQRARE